MNPKFLEYDVVRSTRQLSGCIPSGTIGAILMVFPSEPAHYEVEFVDSEGESLGVLTVEEGDLVFVQHSH